MIYKAKNVTDKSAPKLEVAIPWDESLGETEDVFWPEWHVERALKDKDLKKRLCAHPGIWDFTMQYEDTGSEYLGVFSSTETHAVDLKRSEAEEQGLVPKAPRKYT